MKDQREDAVKLAIGQIEKQFGKGSIMKMGEAGVAPGIEAISSGALSIDIAMGVGGFPKGRVV